MMKFCNDELPIILIALQRLSDEYAYDLKKGESDTTRKWKNEVDRIIIKIEEGE